MYRIIVHRRAARYLQRFPRPQRERIRTSLSDLASEPIHRPGVRPMLGEWTGYYQKINPSRMALTHFRQLFLINGHKSYRFIYSELGGDRQLVQGGIQIAP